MKQKFLLFSIVGTPLLVGLVIVGYWFWADVIHKKPLLPTLGQVGEFSLLNEDSALVRRDALVGRITIADFIFTECAGACPMMSSQMSDLQKSLSDEPRVQFASFSVDPETDKPGVLTQYAKQYGAVKGKWMFLTGDKAQIYRLIRKDFHLAVDSDTGDGGGILHSQKFVLIDQTAAIRGYYDSDDSVAMSSLVVDAERLSNQVR